MRVYLILVLTSSAALAQVTSGRISGTVFDTSGAVVPNAPVVAKHAGTAQTRQTESNETGFYVFPDLPPGKYDISVELQGFKKFAETGIDLSANTKLTINAHLTPGVVSEVVEVAALTNRVETSSGEIGTVITDKQVTQLSLNGRNYVQLLQLIPGVTVSYTSSFNLTGTADQQINGLRGNTSGFMVDGAWNLNVGSNGTPHVSPNVDNIQEVKVTTSAYAAEYGQNQGAQINVITKSGSRDFHGALYEFVRNDKFDASDWISNRSGAQRPTLRYHNYGFNLGGPAFIPHKWNTDRTKAFFFVALSFSPKRNATTRTGLVPTAEERRGDFRNSPLTAPIDPGTRQPYNPSNPRVLPQSLWSRNGPALLEPFPLPNINGQGFNYVTQTVARGDQDQQIFRGDYNLGPKTQIFVRGIRDNFDFSDTGNGSALAMVGNANNRKGVIWSLNVSQTLAPTLVNTFNFSWSGTRIENYSLTQNFQRDALRLAIPELFPGTRLGAGPDVSIQGFTGYGIGSNLSTFHHLFLLREDVNHIRGNHSLKFGIWVERYRANANVLQSGARENGAVAFSRASTISTGNPVADVLVGNFQSYSESSPDSVIFTRFWQNEGYAQDTWRIKPNFSIEYGVRFVHVGPVYSAVNNLIAFRPRFYDPAKAPRFNADGSLVPGVGDFIGNFYVNGLAINGDGWPDRARGRVDVAGDPAWNRMFRGVPRGSYQTPFLNVSPRFSFAWDPSGAGNWSIRGGGGITYDRIRSGSTVLTGNGIPFLNRVTIFDANIDRPAGGRSPIFPSSPTSWGDDVRVPRVFSYSFGFQRRLPHALLAEARYQGTQARFITMGTDLNQLPVGTRLRPGAAAVPRDSLRPYPGFGTITWLSTPGSSSYNALQTSLQRRFQQGVGLGVAYTWGRTITNAYGEQGNAVQDTYNIAAERSVADFDRTHVLVFNYIWELPLFRGRRDILGKALGGWELSGITNFTSGATFTPSFSFSGDPTGTGATASRPDHIGPIAYLNPRETRTFRLPNGASVAGNFFFDPVTPFAIPPAGRFGNSARGVIRGPGMNNWDVSLFKNIPVTDRLSAQFRAELFNFFNHVSFSGIGTGLPATATTNTFGQVTGVAPARTLQLGLKVLF
jgi:hypothetical protein